MAAQLTQQSLCRRLSAAPLAAALTDAAAQHMRRYRCRRRRRCCLRRRPQPTSRHLSLAAGAGGHRGRAAAAPPVLPPPAIPFPPPPPPPPRSLCSCAAGVRARCRAAHAALARHGHVASADCGALRHRCHCCVHPPLLHLQSHQTQRTSAAHRRCHAGLHAVRCRCCHALAVAAGPPPLPWVSAAAGGQCRWASCHQMPWLARLLQGPQGLPLLQQGQGRPPAWLQHWQRVPPAVLLRLPPARRQPLLQQPLPLRLLGRQVQLPATAPDPPASRQP